MNADSLTKQVSVFLENKSGRLAEVCRVLANAAINIRGLCIAETSDFGILRLIVNDPGQALKTLREAGFAVGEAHVLALQVPDRPGGLSGVLELLKDKSINVEYMYAMLTQHEGQALILFRVADEQIEATLAALEEGKIGVVPGEQVYGL